MVAAFEIVHAHIPEYLPAARELFLEYARSLDFKLCFQEFEKELATLPGAYSPPKGALILALECEEPVGCAGLREIGEGVCEMKRLYVRPEFRGREYGRQLAERIVLIAKEFGYSKMRLDTVSTMTQAISLYRSLGFRETEAYYDNPLPNVVYFELDL